MGNAKHNDSNPTQQKAPRTFKSFRNDTSHFMRDALGGLVAAHPLATWHEEGFIGVSGDQVDSAPRIAVVSGGGSGHEPMHAGFVGPGMLDAACPGLLFTSPPTRCRSARPQSGRTAAKAWCTW